MTPNFSKTMKRCCQMDVVSKKKEKVALATSKVPEAQVKEAS